MKVEAGSITLWLRQLQTGDPEAAKELWSRLYPQLVNVAAKHFRKNTDPATGPEDVAQIVYHNVCSGLMDGKFAGIENRGELWNLLFVATINRVRRHYRDLSAQKRPRFSSHNLDELPDSILEDLRTPDSEIIMADLLENLLDRLDIEDPSGELRNIATLRLDELSAESIARSLRKRKTIVLQKIRLIRLLWQQSIEQ